MSIVKESTLVCSPASSNGDRCRVAVSSERAPKAHPHRTCRRRLQLVEPIAGHVFFRPNARMSTRARPGGLLAPRKMCNHFCVLGCTLQRDPAFASTTRCLVLVMVLASPRLVAKSEAAGLMHVRVVTVASEAWVSVRGASGKPSVEEYSAQSPVTRRTMPMNPSGVPASWERAASKSPRRGFASWRAVGHIPDVIAKQLHFTNSIAQKIEHHPLHPHLQKSVFQSVPTDVSRVCAEVHDEDPQDTVPST